MNRREFGKDQPVLMGKNRKRSWVFETAPSQQVAQLWARLESFGGDTGNKKRNCLILVYKEVNRSPLELFYLASSSVETGTC